MQKKLFLLLFSVIISVSAFSQRTISGTVIDDENESLPGVSVVIKGTTTGTITDFDGNYQLTNVAVGATLEFSYIGMKSQEHKVGASTSVLNVTLQSSTQMIEEVVVTAMGIQQEKKRMNFAVQTVDTESLTDSK